MAFKGNTPRVEPPDRGLRPTASLTEERVSLWEHVSVLYRYRRIAGTIFAFVLIIGTLQTYTTVPRYRATAQIIFSINTQSPVPDEISPTATGTGYFMSEMRTFFEKAQPAIDASIVLPISQG